MGVIVCAIAFKQNDTSSSSQSSATQPKSESGRKCNPQTSADVLSSSSPRQQRGRVPIMANSSIPPRNECPTGKRNQSSNNQTQNHSVCTTTRVNTYPPRNTTEAGKAHQLSINHNSHDHQVHVQPNTEHTTTKPPPKVQIHQQTRRDHIPTIVQTCPSRILNQEISSSSSIIRQFSTRQ